MPAFTQVKFRFALPIVRALTWIVHAVAWWNKYQMVMLKRKANPLLVNTWPYPIMPTLPRNVKYLPLTFSQQIAFIQTIQKQQKHIQQWQIAGFESLLIILTIQNGKLKLYTKPLKRKC